MHVHGIGRGGAPPTTGEPPGLSVSSAVLMMSGKKIVRQRSLLQKKLGKRLSKTRTRSASLTNNPHKDDDNEENDNDIAADAGQVQELSVAEVVKSSQLTTEPPQPVPVASDVQPPADVKMSVDDENDHDDDDDDVPLSKITTAAAAAAAAVQPAVVSPKQQHQQASRQDDKKVLPQPAQSQPQVVPSVVVPTAPSSCSTTSVSSLPVIASPLTSGEQQQQRQPPLNGTPTSILKRRIKIAINGEPLSSLGAATSSLVDASLSPRFSAAPSTCNPLHPTYTPPIGKRRVSFCESVQVEEIEPVMSKAALAAAAAFARLPPRFQLNRSKLILPPQSANKHAVAAQQQQPLASQTAASTSASASVAENTPATAPEPTASTAATNASPTAASSSVAMSPSLAAASNINSPLTTALCPAAASLLSGISSSRGPLPVSALSQSPSAPSTAPSSAAAAASANSLSNSLVNIFSNRKPQANQLGQRSTMIQQQMLQNLLNKTGAAAAAVSTAAPVSPTINGHAGQSTATPAAASTITPVETVSPVKQTPVEKQAETPVFEEEPEPMVVSTSTATKTSTLGSVEEEMARLEKLETASALDTSIECEALNEMMQQQQLQKPVTPDEMKKNEEQSAAVNETPAEAKSDTVEQLLARYLDTRADGQDANCDDAADFLAQLEQFDSQRLFRVCERVEELEAKLMRVKKRVRITLAKKTASANSTSSS